MTTTKTSRLPRPAAHRNQRAPKGLDLPGAPLGMPPNSGGAMQIVTQKIAPCLWFDTQAEEAAKFYVSVFKNSRDIHGKEAGSVMAVDFELSGQEFVELNGGPQFTF